MEFYKLVENCEYGTMKSEMIRDRLVVGIRDTALSEQLQIDAYLTLRQSTSSNKSSKEPKQEVPLERYR